MFLITNRLRAMYSTNLVVHGHEGIYDKSEPLMEVSLPGPLPREEQEFSLFNEYTQREYNFIAKKIDLHYGAGNKHDVYRRTEATIEVVPVGEPSSENEATYALFNKKKKA